MKTKKEPNLEFVRNKYTAQLKEQVLDRAERNTVANPEGTRRVGKF